ALPVAIQQFLICHKNLQPPTELSEQFIKYPLLATFPFDVKSGKITEIEKYKTAIAEAKKNMEKFQMLYNQWKGGAPMSEQDKALWNHYKKLIDGNFEMQTSFIYEKFSSDELDVIKKAPPSKFFERGDGRVFRVLRVLESNKNGIPVSLQQSSEKSEIGLHIYYGRTGLENKLDFLSAGIRAFLQAESEYSKADMDLPKLFKLRDISPRLAFLPPAVKKELAGELQTYLSEFMGFPFYDLESDLSVAKRVDSKRKPTPA